MKYISYLILTFAIFFNLILYFPETQITLDPNDNIFQFALVRRTNDVWNESRCPLSLSCLPNLIDHWVPNWAEGYPLPYYYSHLPQIAIVASYNLFINPIISLITPISLYDYYNWLKYLLLALFPLPVFIALRVIGINPLLAALSALFATHISTDGLYGIDPPSYLWRGYGLTSQLYSVFFMPLAIAYVYKALSEISSANLRIKISNLFWAILFTTLTIAGHLGMGIILLLTLPIFLFLDTKPYPLKLRFKKLLLIVGISIFILFYWIIPAILNNTYHLISYWDPVWKFNSWGYYDVIKQFFSGEIFDWKRLPVMTTIITIGFFTTITNKKYFIFTLSFAIWMLAFFGRSPWGGLIDLIPGMKDFHLSRFVVGVHIASLFLIPFGLNYIFQQIEKITKRIIKFLPGQQKLSFYLISIVFIIILIILTYKQTIDYASLNNKWIKEANVAFRYEEKNFNTLIDTLKKLPPGRIYAGRPGNWGKDFRFSSTQMYLATSVMGLPISQFLPESWSPNSDNEQMFDERVTEDYNLYNLAYIIAPANFTPPSQAQLIKQFSPFYLYQMRSTGYFDIVSSNMQVKADKTNFINIVHVWQKSYSRLWNMHPLITLENQSPPSPSFKTISMTDEANYTANGKELNIFADYPLTFPEATVSGKTIDFSNDKPGSHHTYKGEVTIPEGCTNCFTLFKMTYHPGWKATLDGKESEIYPIFPFFMSLPTSPGKHTVEFTYQPSNLKIAIIIFEIFIFLFVIFKNKIKSKLTT